MSTVISPANRGRSTRPADPDYLAGVKPGYWVLDAEASNLQIGVKIGGLVSVHGRFTHLSGAMILADNCADSSIDVTVNTDSLTSGSTHWDSVLMGAGLVDTQSNPTIGFRSQQLRTVHSRTGDTYELDGVLTTNRGELDLTFELRCLGQQTDRVRFRATGSISSKNAVALLSQPGLERVIGKTMTIDLTVEAVRGKRPRTRS